MAQADGVLVTLAPYETVEVINGVPIGPLIVPYELNAQTGVTEIIQDRFPPGHTAAAFLIDVADEDRKSSGVTSVIVSALTPGGLYLEPTIGQIWPR